MFLMALTVNECRYTAAAAGWMPVSFAWRPWMCGAGLFDGLASSLDSH